MWGLHELAQCTWCRLGEAKDSTPPRHSNSAQNTLRDKYGYVHACVGGMELSHSTTVQPDGTTSCTHLMMDCDLTQSRHCPPEQHGTVSDLAISDISRHLQTGRDGALTAHTLDSATSSLTFFLIQLITLIYLCI